jgi:hypothetical protein
MAKPLAGQLVNAVRDRRGDRHDADLINAGGRIIASNDPSMDLCNIAHSYDGIIVEVRLLDRATFNSQLLKQRGAQSKNHGALDLAAPEQVDAELSASSA